MEDRGLRDIERWRDKIEVRLDNRQVFFLFFGSALVACMLFVLGVIVGKRLESRGRAVSPEIEDPLALLDKVATTPRTTQTGVTFPQALFGNGKAAAVDKHGKKNLLQSPAPMPAPLAPEKPEPAKTVAVLEPTKAAPAAPRPSTPATQATEARPVAEKAPSKATAKAEARAEAQPAEPAPEAKPVATAKPKVVLEPKEAKPAPAAVAKAIGLPTSIPTVAAGDTKGKGHFSLQLSSFQDKAEAEAFAQKFEGERPYLVVSEIPGKGTWYRVRVGDFATSKDAVAGKASFEKKHNVIAYVAQK
jgi:septal ring-binding cell division protein DamX